MRFKMLSHVNTRTAGGRVFSAMEGTTSEVDDNDTDMCDAIREQAARGTVEILKGKKAADTDGQKDGDGGTGQDTSAAADGTEPPRKAATVQRGGRTGRGA